jgi:hypothetical protein
VAGVLAALARRRCQPGRNVDVALFDDECLSRAAGARPRYGDPHRGGNGMPYGLFGALRPGVSASQTVLGNRLRVIKTGMAPDARCDESAAGQ